MAVKASLTKDRLAFGQVYEGDARELAPRLPDRSIAVTLTSPPYWGMKDYGVTGQIGRGQEFQEYMKDLAAIFQHVHRATRDTVYCPT